MRTPKTTMDRSRISFGLLSHRGGNIGHEIMAIGLEEILTATFGAEIQIIHFEQHQHFCAYPGWHPLKLVDKLPHGRAKAFRFFLNRPKVCDFLWQHMEDWRFLKGVMACGGPNIVPGVSRSPEMGLMCHHLLGGFAAQGINVLNLGVGSCYPLERLPVKIDGEGDRHFFQRLFSYCRVNTVRDRLAQKLWQELGRETPLIPCAALVAGYRIERLSSGPSETATKKMILINFQAKGANEDWNQGVDAEAWKKTVQSLIQKLVPQYRVAFLCHNNYEYQLAARVDSRIERFLPQNFAQYVDLIRQVSVAMVSRIHAAITLATFGIPSVVIGTDSRLGAVEMLGLPHFYVKNVDAGFLEEKLQTLLKTAEQEKERLLSLRAETLKGYQKIILAHIK